MRKAIALIMVFLCLACIAPVNAVGSSEQEVRNAINETLSLIEPEKAAYGLGAANFGNLAIGSPVTAYEYKNGGYSKLNFTLYPLLNGSNLMAFAIVQKFGPGDVTAQIDVELSREINAKNLMNKEIAIVYDEDACYAATDDGFVLLRVSDIETPSRDKITSLSATSSSLVKNSLSSKFSLGYHAYSSVHQNGSRTIQSTIHLNVPIITQTPATDQICWACCVASIARYKTNNSTISEVDIAKSVHGSYYNIGAPIETAVGKLGELTGFIYSVYDYPPSTNTIYNILDGDNPIYSSWVNMTESGRHATVIRGVSDTLQVISLMNPTFSTYVYVNWSSTYNTYAYVSSLSANTFVLDYYASL